MNEHLLSHELLLMQQSSLPTKYSQWMEEFQDIPHQWNRRMMKPMSQMNQRISKLVKNRGKMLMLLDQRVSKIFKKMRS